MSSFDLNKLRAAVDGAAVAIRSITRLEPAGGSGDKVFPPTYMKGGRAETKYAMEMRLIDGNEVQTVLLDSVASQANRTEEALLQGWLRQELSFPVVQVDFSGEPGLEDIGQITALQAPHRIADAILRDSMLDGMLFRYTPIGRSFTDSRPANAVGMYRYCPTALIFGVWDSTGPKGGLGAKFQRCLVSEIVGIGAVAGVKTASRIDPLGIARDAGPVYQSRDDKERWTVDGEAARKDKKGTPEIYTSKGSAEGKGKPAAINHGNIPPSIDGEAGGVTMSHAVQTTVLSLAGLRRLRFPVDVDGRPVPQDQRVQAETAARTALAALGLAGMVYLRENDFDLRSRSLLVPVSPLRLELVGRDGGPTEQFELGRQDAAGILAAAEQSAREFNLGWDRGPVTLRPAPKLAELVRRSRALVAAGAEEE